jgi:hypothetical protein
VTERNPKSEGPGEEREPALPADEEAAWAQIVAAYGEEPDATAEDMTGTTGQAAADGDTATDRRDGTGPADGDGPGGDRAENRSGEPETGTPARSFTVYAAGTGPRDWQAPDGEDDDHFVPPEPPPLPETDATTKFAWLAALGGPLLLLGAVLFDVYLSWWIVTLGVGGFLGGFATLLTRLRDGADDDLDDPGSGAVV